MIAEPRQCSACGHWPWEHVTMPHYEPGMGSGLLTVCPVDPVAEEQWLERQSAAKEQQ